MFNKSTRKKSGLIELLCNVDKRRNYYFYIASCYFTTEAGEQLVKEVKKLINIEEIYIYIDRKTALGIDKEVLEEWLKKFDGLVYLYPVNHSSLFHSKGYALLGFDDESEEIIGGSLVVGSANLTGNGIFSKKGNIECLLDTQKLDHLIEFESTLESLDYINLEDLESFENKEDINFKYAMLMEGEFVHSWTDDLKSILSVTYNLNQNGKEKTKTDPALATLGFNLESLSVSKNYINFEVNNYLSKEFHNLKRNFGIECHLGYWIPNGVYESCLDGEKGFEQFKQELISYLNEEKSKISEEITNDYNKLLEIGLIEKNSQEPQKLFLEKVENIIKDSERLLRIYTKLHVYELPYDISDIENIESLFNEISELARSKKKKSEGVRAWLAGIENQSLDALREIIGEE